MDNAPSTADSARPWRRSYGRRCRVRSRQRAGDRLGGIGAYGIMKAWFFIVFTGFMFGSLGLCTKYLTTRGVDPMVCAAIPFGCRR